jgi:hypothetical protein
MPQSGGAAFKSPRFESLLQDMYRSRRAAPTGGRPLKVVHIHDVHAKRPYDALGVAALGDAPGEVGGARVSPPNIIPTIDLHLHLLA